MLLLYSNSNRYSQKLSNTLNKIMKQKDELLNHNEESHPEFLEDNQKKGRHKKQHQS